MKAKNQPKISAQIVLLGLLTSSGSVAAERYEYVCRVNEKDMSDELIGFTLKWTDVPELSGAIASELRLNQSDASDNHYFGYQPDAYITISDSGYKNDPQAFFPISGDHNKNLLKGFFLSNSALYSLSIKPWDSGEFSLVKHDSCTRLEGGKCKDFILYEGNCASVGVGKQFESFNQLID